MRSNVRGRVQNTNLPKTQALLPLFEAIINSVEAIEDSGRPPAEGQIEVEVLRHAPFDLPDLETSEQIVTGPIFEFRVTDNGVGFTEENYRSFNVADSRYKVNRGGKGVGRFIWLKAFEKVRIESTFARNGNLAHRVFEFSLATDDGVTEIDIRDRSSDEEHRTLVCLQGFREEYEKSVPKSGRTVAQRIVEHCLEYFVLNRMPSIILRDDQLDSPIDLHQVYHELVTSTDAVSVIVGSREFLLRHFLLLAYPGLENHVSFCANGRVVQTIKLDEKRIPNLPARLTSDEDEVQYAYAAYVSADYLDQRVNQQRTGFDTPLEGSLMDPDDVLWSDIEQKVIAAIRSLLEPHTEASRLEKEKRIREYVNNRAPEYRYILNRFPEELDAIPADLTERSLEIRLYELHRKIEIRVHNRAEEILASGVTIRPDRPYKEQLEQFARFWEDFNDVGKADLARYIVQRKLMLSILEEALKVQGDGKYAREDVIHAVIFPLRSTSDEVGYSEHNLWIIDEKLAYHRYLASDMPLRKVDGLDSQSMSRPDLLIFFDRPIAVVDDEYPYSSGVVIFEFKRPMRDDYEPNENPIQQVLKYVREIKLGSLRDRGGRPFRVHNTTPFYCYVVCDLTKRLEEQAENAGYTRTPDGQGFFGYNPSLGVYVEVISFDKLLDDAKKRNRVLFEMLKLPDRLFPPGGF